LANATTRQAARAPQSAVLKAKTTQLAANVCASATDVEERIDWYDRIDTDVTEPTSKDCPVIIGGVAAALDYGNRSFILKAPYQGTGKNPSVFSSRTLYRCDKLAALSTLWQQGLS